VDIEASPYVRLLDTRQCLSRPCDSQVLTLRLSTRRRGQSISWLVPWEGRRREKARTPPGRPWTASRCRTRQTVLVPSSTRVESDPAAHATHLPRLRLELSVRRGSGSHRPQMVPSYP